MLPADDRLDSLSKVLFGQTHRLRVMIWIARSDGLINPTELADGLGVPAQSAIQASMRDLERAGLLVRQPRGGDRRTYFRRVDSLAWNWVLELAAGADALHA